jgi:hypothetical protein
LLRTRKEARDKNQLIYETKCDLCSILRIISSSNRSLFVGLSKCHRVGGCFKIPASDRRPITGCQISEHQARICSSKLGSYPSKIRDNYFPQKDLSVRPLLRYDKSRNPSRQQGRNKLFRGSRRVVVALAYSNDDSTMQAGDSEIGCLTGSKSFEYSNG